MKRVDPEIKEYILRVAKEQYVERRDNPLDVIPKVVIPNAFYITEYKKYVSELERLKNLTEEEAKVEEANYRKEQLEDYRKYIAKEERELENLINLLEKVKKWNCKDTLLELKNFIVLEIGSKISQYERRQKSIPCVDVEVSGNEFKEEMIRRYQNIVDSYRKDVEREQKWANDTNRMIRDLKDDLGDW